ncbi:MAG: DUF814 domain-containing protein [Ignavibacteriae bacterium]|nr:DUF814 domain-containing protein [Ignavibacteriota bacterium]NOG96541.1 DUF814 domain-containing protein [Ignavibacteriota bacterium]
MIKNYFYLLRNTIELTDELVNCSVNEIYSQEKDKIYLRLASEQFPHKHLIISSDQNMPYLYVKEDHRKAKKNTINFWDEYLPAEIIKISIAKNERVVKLQSSSFDLYFMIRGNLTNLFLIDNSKNILSFKKLKNENNYYLDILENLEFIDSKYEISEELKSINEMNYSAFRKTYPHIGREIFNEAKFIFENKMFKSFGESINSTIKKVLNDKIVVAYNSPEGKVSMLPKSFEQANELENPIQVSKIKDAVKNYISEYYHNFEFYKLKKELNSYFDKEMHRLSEKINKLKYRIELGSREDEYRKLGSILLANIHSLKKGFKKITLSDYETGEQIDIKLKETSTPNENVNLYFDKAKDEKINFGKSKEIYETSIKNYSALAEKQAAFLNSESVDEFKSLRKELNIGSVKKLKKETKLDIKYKQYRIDDKYDLYVGKDSRSNDLLSIKFAKQNDYWFHARGMPGSHVILRSDTPKEVVPKPVLKKAASIAAYHSKAKTAGIVPVSYTFAKFVYKKKGMEPGQVFLSKEKVLTVQPGVPAGCELINE